MVPKQNDTVFAPVSINTAFPNTGKLYSDYKYLGATVPMRDKERPWEYDLGGRRPDKQCHLDEKAEKHSPQDWPHLLKTDHAEQTREGGGAAKVLQRQMCH